LSTGVLVVLVVEKEDMVASVRELGAVMMASLLAGHGAMNPEC
jgi:hypothetical protein